MSSFLVRDETINQVIAFLYTKALGDPYYWPARQLLETGYDLSDEDHRLRLASEMARLNRDAVNGRYRPDQVQYLEPGDFTYKSIPPRPIIATLKALDCWWYQCTEADIPECKLYKLMAEVRNRLAGEIVRDLPAYEQAKWG